MDPVPGSKKAMGSPLMTRLESAPALIMPTRSRPRKSPMSGGKDAYVGKMEPTTMPRAVFALRPGEGSQGTTRTP